MNGILNETYFQMIKSSHCWFQTSSFKKSNCFDINVWSTFSDVIDSLLELGKLLPIGGCSARSLVWLKTTYLTNKRIRTKTKYIQFVLIDLHLHFDLMVIVKDQLVFHMQPSMLLNVHVFFSKIKFRLKIKTIKFQFINLWLSSILFPTIYIHFRCSNCRSNICMSTTTIHRWWTREKFQSIMILLIFSFNCIHYLR